MSASDVRAERDATATLSQENLVDTGTEFEGRELRDGNSGSNTLCSKDVGTASHSFKCILSLYCSIFEIFIITLEF